VRIKEGGEEKKGKKRRKHRANAIEGKVWSIDGDPGVVGERKKKERNQPLFTWGEKKREKEDQHPLPSARKKSVQPAPRRKLSRFTLRRRGREGGPCGPSSPGKSESGLILKPKKYLPRRRRGKKKEPLYPPVEEKC